MLVKIILIFAACVVSTSLAGNVILLRPREQYPYPSSLHLGYRTTLGTQPSVVLVPALLAPIPENSEEVDVDPEETSAKERSQLDLSGNQTENGNATVTKKPRCLTSLFSWYAKKKVMGAMENFNAPDIPDFRAPPGSGLQGGINSPGVGGIGGVSPLTPDLTQANNALQDANLMEGQVNSAQAQLNANLAGIPNSGIPLSPGLLRDDDGRNAETQLQPQFNLNSNLNPTGEDYGTMAAGFRSFSAQVPPPVYVPSVMYSQPGAFYYS